MIDFIARELIFAAWVAGAAGSWRTLKTVVLPFALDRCPWGEDP